MAKYKLKIKSFGLFTPVKQAAGSVLETTGKIAQGGIGKTAGFLAGMGSMGKAAAIGTSVAGPLGGLVAGLAAPFLVKKAVSSVGEGVKNAGQDMKINAV